MVKAVSKIFILIWFLIFINNPFCSAQIPDTIVQNNSSYSFIVAGHTYGSHTGTNKGLYPVFLNYLKKHIKTYDFIIFTGDVIRGSNGNWNTLKKELTDLNKPFWLVMGNNENSTLARNYYKKTYGNTFYFFKKNNDLFIILNTQLEERKITKKQLKFVENILLKEKNVTNIFVFFHELLWNCNIKYKNINSNKRSRYGNIQQSNFWSELFPILKKESNKKIFIIAGDVGGNINAIPAFYDKYENICFLASGMGEIVEENYLYISVYRDTVELKLIPLQKGVKLKNIEEYNTKNMSSYFKPKYSVILDKIKKNITHVQFIRGVLVTSIFYIFIIIISILIKNKFRKK